MAIINDDNAQARGIEFLGFTKHRKLNLRFRIWIPSLGKAVAANIQWLDYLHQSPTSNPHTEEILTVYGVITPALVEWPRQNGDQRGTHVTIKDRDASPPLADHHANNRWCLRMAPGATWLGAPGEDVEADVEAGQRLDQRFSALQVPGPAPRQWADQVVNAGWFAL